MKTYRTALLIAISFTIGQTFSQTIPTAPNQRNSEGKRIGEWVITYTKNWKETRITDSIAFYRKIAFDKTGKPQGKTRDYYRSGVIKFEGKILRIEPIVFDGFCVQYDENGNATKQYFEKGEEIDWFSLFVASKIIGGDEEHLEAIKLAEKSERIAKLIIGEDNPKYIQILINLANLYQSKNQYSKAESYHLRILIIAKKIFGETNVSYAATLNNLAELYHIQDQYIKAEPYYLEAIKIFRKNLIEKQTDSGDQSNYAISLSSLARLYRSQGQYSKAEPYYMQALAIRKKALGEEHPDYATSLNNLAALYLEQGQYSKAEPYYMQALAIRKKALGEEHPDYATSLNNLAALYLEQGQYSKVEPHILQALAIIKEVLGEEHPDYDTSLNNLAELYRIQGQYSKAERYFLQALAIRKKAYGEEHPSYATILNNLAFIYYEQGQYSKSEPYYLKALAIIKKIQSEEHPDYGRSLSNLALLYESKGQYSKAERYFLQALAIRKKARGEKHPDYAISLNNMAGLYLKQGQYSKAELYYLQALNIYEKFLSGEHPHYATILSNLASLYKRQGQYDKAESYHLKSVHIEKNNLLIFLETADQAQQEALIRTREFTFKLGYSFGLLAKTPASATSAYETSILMKGVQLQNTTQLLNYVRQSKDTLLLVQHEQWLALKRSINTQNNQPIAKRVGVVVMQEQADSLYKIMARRSVAFRNFKAAFQITPQAIQQKLKPQEAAIEFVHFQYNNGKRWTDSIYYAALVLRKGWADPRMVYLCEQRTLDSLLNLKGKEERNSQYVERIYGYGNRGIEIDKEKPLRSLYTLLWQPIDSLLTGVSTVYYSPSGLLNRLNIAAIATPTPRQRLLDKYTQLVQLRSTREIVMPQEPITYTQQALLMGGIEYNLDSLVYKRVNASYKQNRGDNTLSLPNSRGGIYNPLYATDEEISNTQNLMQSEKWKADTLKGLRASEEAFQYYATQKPRVIHLATHGFFLEDTLTRRKRDENLRFDKEPTLLTSSDPMQRSGLVLAGGNHAWQGKTPIPNQADGLLTASEIGAMVLNNTELAVLSACETGLGDVKGSEGVFGLQRAFKMAGVKYLLMSLWKVDDEITSKFMTKFYGNWLINKTSVREAFQSTVKQFYKDYPNPYNWAAFVLLE